MIAAVLSAVAAIVALALGTLVYRRRVAGRLYEGSMTGVYTLGSVLGVLFGLGIGLATLSVVLTLRALR